MLAGWRVRRAMRATPAQPPVLVYQMGKVGSTSVTEALAQTPLRHRVLAVHFLSDDLPAHIRMLRAAGEDPVPYHFYVSQALQAILARNPGTPVKLISLVRDPIAIVVSDLFQNPQLYPEACLPGTATIDPHRATRYLDVALRRPEAFRYVFEWLDREIKAVFGIDVFAEPFDLAQGFGRYRAGPVELLLLRLEDLGAHGAEALADFLGLGTPLEIRLANARATTADAADYARLKRILKLDPALCRTIYDSRFVRQFYGAEQVAAFMATWT